VRCVAAGGGLTIYLVEKALVWYSSRGRHHLAQSRRAGKSPGGRHGDTNGYAAEALHQRPKLSPMRRTAGAGTRHPTSARPYLPSLWRFLRSRTRGRARKHRLTRAGLYVTLAAVWLHGNQMFAAADTRIVRSDDGNSLTELREAEEERGTRSPLRDFG
jgi:hypothetical protein